MPRLGTTLSWEVLTRRAARPRKPSAVTLEGELVRLVPLDVDRDAEELHAVSVEGIQDAHYIVKGRNRDTAWFRMLDSEWPAAGRRLGELLQRSHGVSHGGQ